MILFAIFIFATNLLDHIILSITYPFLEGSSKGKSIILFAVMGSLLLFYPLFRSDGLIGEHIFSLSPKLEFNSQKYLKFTLILMFFTYLIGQLIEMLIRVKMGVSLFTIFTAYNSSGFSSTAMTHSHAFKSVLGFVLQSGGIHFSSTINAGDPLAMYTLPLALIVLITFPLIYIAGITALSERRDLIKVIMAFALTILFIGMLDGGILDFPSWIGLFILLGIYFIKKPYLRNVSKPMIIIVILFLLRFSVSVFGTNTEFHEITIIDPSDNINLNGYDVLDVQKEGNKMIVKVPGNLFDKTLLLNLTSDLDGKCSGFFLSWNIYSYI